MFVFLLIVTVIVIVLLFVTAALQPIRPTMSMFEIERRTKSGDHGAALDKRRLQYTGDILSTIRIKTALLLVLSTVLLIVTFGWAIGILVSVVIALQYGAIARSPFIRKIATSIYARFEQSTLDRVEKYPQVFKFIRSVTPSIETTHIDSREELQHLVSVSEDVLTADERKLIVNSLSFKDRLVESIMIPRTAIVSIEHTEFLGPLTLSELHKLGHSRLPVTRGDIDHVVGVLHMQSLLELDNKRSMTAGKAMDPRVCYIRHDQTLHHALTAFLRTHQHLFVVVNEFRETVGLLSLEDVIEALIGRKIVDEFDSHDDLRAVALRNPSDNNEPKHHEDV